MINYPLDRAVREQASRHEIPAAVLIRDLVRIVEVLNLRKQGFFNKASVLAGSMALRSLGSPRFTVYDADFSTSRETVSPETAMKRMLAYEDDELTITPGPVVPHRDAGKMWKSEVGFAPAFTGLIPSAADRQFKADISFRGLVRDGLEVPFKVPYSLDLWTEAPSVFIMDPVETAAEKILGWCVHGQVKHYADLAYIALASQKGVKDPMVSSAAELREATADKLEVMRALQPDKYEPFQSLDDLCLKLEAKPQFDQQQWQNLIYVRANRDRFSRTTIRRAVQQILVPMLK